MAGCIRAAELVAQHRGRGGGPRPCSDVISPGCGPVRALVPGRSPAGAAGLVEVPGRGGGGLLCGEGPGGRGRRSRRGGRACSRGGPGRGVTARPRARRSPPGRGRPTAGACAAGAAGGPGGAEGAEASGGAGPGEQLACPRPRGACSASGRALLAGGEVAFVCAAGSVGGGQVASCPLAGGGGLGGLGRVAGAGPRPVLPSVLPGVLPLIVARPGCGGPSWTWAALLKGSPRADGRRCGWFSCFRQPRVGCWAGAGLPADRLQARFASGQLGDRCRADRGVGAAAAGRPRDRGRAARPEDSARLPGMGPGGPAPCRATRPHAGWPGGAKWSPRPAPVPASSS